MTKFTYMAVNLVENNFFNHCLELNVAKCCAKLLNINLLHLHVVTCFWRFNTRVNKYAKYCQGCKFWINVKCVTKQLYDEVLKSLG